MQKLYMSMLFVGGTVVTGIILVVLNSSSLGSACISGIVYMGIVGIELMGTKKRLVRIKDQNSSVHSQQDQK